jgi:hypothetical protein
VTGAAPQSCHRRACVVELARRSTDRRFRP